VAELVAAEAARALGAGSVPLRKGAPTVALPQRKPHVAVLTPARGGLHPGYVAGLFDAQRALAEAGVGISWKCLPNHALLAFARNLLAAEFLADGQATHALWIDSDIGFSGADVLSLLSRDLDACCGLYRGRQDGADWEFQHLHDAAGDAVPTGPGPLIEVEWASAGFLMVRREVFLRLIEAGAVDRIEHCDWPVEDSCRPWLHEFFFTGVVGGYF
jgi:hypothetical protein